MRVQVNTTDKDTGSLIESDKIALNGQQQINNNNDDRFIVSRDDDEAINNNQTFNKKGSTKSAPHQEKPSAIKLISLKLVTLTTILSFLASGLLINLMQLVNYLTVRHLNFLLFIKINYYLMYSAWSQIIALFDWFFGSHFTVYHARPEQQDEIFSEHNIFLANHGYELDWIGAWLVTDKFGQSASCKAMLKSDLKYLPVVGWSWAMSDQLFLDRNWEKDKHKFGSSMDQLLRYEPMIATFFCEGTRFTKDKIEASEKFAKERGMVAPKYHLIPRTKGFVAVMRHIRQRKRENPDLKLCIYNAQIAFEDDGAMNIGDIMRKALRPKGHIYFERIPLEQVPEDDEACAQWLHNLYLGKDKLQEYFNENKCFPGYQDRRFKPYRPRLASLFNWLSWSSYTAMLLVSFFGSLYARYGAFHVSLVMSVCFTLSYVYLNYIMYQADVSKKEKSTTRMVSNGSTIRSS